MCSTAGKEGRWTSSGSVGRVSDTRYGYDLEGGDASPERVFWQEYAAKREEEEAEQDAWLRDKTGDILDKLWLEERERRRQEKRRLVARLDVEPGRAPRWEPEEAPITE